MCALGLRRTSRSLLVCSSLPLFVACSGDELTDSNGDGIDDGILAPNNVTVVTPTKPTGFVAGLVTHALTGEPLAGASVAIFGGGVSGTTMTDANGEFQLGPVAAGAGFGLRVSMEAYGIASVTGLEIDDAAGNLPTSNGGLYVGPVSLVPLTGTFAVQVVSADGAPVVGANVAIESLVEHFLAHEARGSVVSSASTDADGIARCTGLPDVRLFPPSLERHAALIVTVSPVDLDGDGTVDLRGSVLEVSGRDARLGGLPPLIVLASPADKALEIVASNVSALLGPSARPSELAPNENLRVVFNEPIDRDSALIDLRDETGAVTIAAPFVVGALGNTISIDPAQDLEPGKEYNLAIRVESDNPSAPRLLVAAAPLFARVDPAVAIGVVARFRDLNANLLWGDANDALEVTASIPIGRSGATPAFRAKLWVAVDLNGSAVFGDAQGELPAAGAPYPAPYLVTAAEPAATNGARASGLTRYLTPVGINLPSPLSQLTGGVAFEVRIDAEDNDGAFVTDISGRLAPSKSMGTALLQ